MPQMSKMIQSRDEWKDKAIQRASENRDQRKNQKRHLEKIAELKMQIQALKQADDAKKNS